MLYAWLKHNKDSKQKQNPKEHNSHEENNQLKNSLQEKNNIDPSKQENFSVNLFPSVEQNIENFKEMYGNSDDITTRVFLLGKHNHKAAILFIDGLTDKKLIDDMILKNLQLEAKQAEDSYPQTPDELLGALYQEVISTSEVKIVDTMDDVSLSVLSGDTAIFLEGTARALIIGSKGWPNRAIDEPISEGLIRGPRDGFIENLRTNTTLIRRYLRDPNLRFDAYKVGRRSKKDVVVSYVEGITHPDLVKEVERRLKSIDMDIVPESGYIEQWIEDSFLSPFPQMVHTERPDKVASSLMQGKVAILLDGTPFVLVVPLVFGNTLQSPEDYYDRWIIGTFVRFLRYIAAFIAVFLPSLYIALVSYHQGMIPSKLAFSIAATREGVPFPAFVEALIMAITMELLREAGIRLPKTIGQTIGIVGGLVIGEAAVTAGIVSPIMVIVVAITAIASFSLPSYSVAISFRLMRFGFMVAAALFGLYGVILSYIIINIHIVNLKSFGVPYSSVFAPTFKSDWRDLIIRAPLTMLTKRPIYMQTKDQKPMDKGGNKE